ISADVVVTTDAVRFGLEALSPVELVTAAAGRARFRRAVDDFGDAAEACEEFRYVVREIDEQVGFRRYVGAAADGDRCCGSIASQYPVRHETALAKGPEQCVQFACFRLRFRVRVDAVAEAVGLFDETAGIVEPGGGVGSLEDVERHAGP